ncbi:MAG TPA: 2-C-methyl-D-erythritol 4-phosphate cytidylyltransferase, partial [Hyphomicrobiaceae bacterium]|nr:2-C-methyl-D-erythritol 4-phosphate cytidylyltransferase [Hyphomicrobiaceae bacterium]
MTTAALIVAAGQGTRTGLAVPKQYARLGGESVLARTMRVFLAHPAVDLVIVAIAEADCAHYDHAVPTGHRKLLPQVLGGATRQRSVLNGLQALAGRLGRDGTPARVLIHDAARPFVTAAVIDRVLAALAHAPGAIAAVPLSDTLKRADAGGGRIVGTIERTGLWRAQTPQGFDLEAILAAHEAALAAGRDDLTDDAAVAEWAGLAVQLVQGSETNVKLTTPEDMARAAAMVGESAADNGASEDAVAATGAAMGASLGAAMGAVMGVMTAAAGAAAEVMGAAAKAVDGMRGVVDAGAPDGTDEVSPLAPSVRDNLQGRGEGSDPVASAATNATGSPQPDAREDLQRQDKEAATVASAAAAARHEVAAPAPAPTPDIRQDIRPDIRTGQGFDVHRFAAGDHVWLCGIRIPHTTMLEGHSDADVGLHALTDALLGAIGDGDIGQHFPPSDPQWRGAASHLVLADAARRVRARGGNIANVDVTLLCEAPKIAPHRDAMRTRIAEVLGIEVSRVAVKATTT